MPFAFAAALFFWAAAPISPLTWAIAWALQAFILADGLAGAAYPCDTNAVETRAAAASDASIRFIEVPPDVSSKEIRPWTETQRRKPCLCKVGWLGTDRINLG